MNFESVLRDLLQGKKLSYTSAESVFSALFRGELPESSAKSLLLLLASRGETAEELSACVDALRRLEPPSKLSYKNTLDTCGTGGDGKHSINVSTLAAFVVAGAGGRVAKHGNRAISSRTGSSDVLEALGVQLDAPSSVMKKAVGKAGIGYFHAPLYHPVFARVQPLRKKLGVRTIFNLLGPLVNPCQVDYQLTGVSRPEHLNLYAEVFRRRKTLKGALVCRSDDGMDEVSTRAVTRYVRIRKGRVSLGKIDPRKLGLHGGTEKDFKGGSAKQNALRARRILEGREHGPARNLIVLNAAAALWTSEIAVSIKEGVRLAENSLDSGRARKALENLVQMTASRSRS